MKRSIVPTVILALSPFSAFAADTPTVLQPQQAETTDAIARQIGWLVIQNANLQAQIEDLKKKIAEPQCSPGDKPIR